jgi:hypothetical protein
MHALIHVCLLTDEQFVAYQDEHENFHDRNQGSLDGRQQMQHGSEDLESFHLWRNTCVSGSSGREECMEWPQGFLC